ncbi:MAG: PfkB family carbohydrate kinase [Gemmatimonadota bacterium]
MRIAAVGECTIDRYLDLGIERVGGISLNFAIHARRAGAEHVALLSCTGTDAGSHAVTAKLITADIDTTHLHHLPGATASQAIRLSAGGERIFPAGGYDPGVLANFRLSLADLNFLRSVDVIAVPWFRQIVHLVDPILQMRDLAAMRIADLLDGADLGPDLDGIAPLLDHFDVLFISGTETTVERLLPHTRRSRTLIVVTHGAAGSSALLNGERHGEPAEPVPADEQIDSTGCGDAFQAGFSVEYFRSRALQGALREGARRAAEVIRHLGATPDEA